MGQVNNQNDSDFRKMVLERLDKLDRGTPMNNAAIGRGGIDIYGGGGLNIQNGGLNVVGSGTFTGTLYADGTIEFTGTLTQSGPSTFTGDFTTNGPTHLNGDVTATGDFATNGPTHLNGATETTGTLDVEGVTTLKNDLNVTTGGKIVAGQTTIRPSGTINFGDTLTISPAGDLGPASISDGFASYTLTPGNPVYFHTFTGGAYIDGRVNAMDLILSALPVTTEPANLYIGTDGVVKRSTA